MSTPTINIFKYGLADPLIETQAATLFRFRTRDIEFVIPAPAILK